MKEKKWPYSLRIELQGTNPEISGLWMHCEKIEEAFHKLLMIEPWMFSGNVHVMNHNVSKAKIVSNTDNRTIAELSYDYFDHQKTPGIYLYFPQSVAAFEQESGISLSTIKGYQAEAGSLLLAHAIPDGSPGFQRTISYQNLCKEAVERLGEYNLVYVSFSQNSFHVIDKIPRKANTVPLREDFLYRDPDQALLHLLESDFNGLDESVAWENDLSHYISSAGIYRFSSRFDHDFDNIVQLCSVRASDQKAPGIQIRISGIPQTPPFNYPFHKLQKVSDSPPTYQVGNYNSVLSKAAKTELFLAPFEQEKTGQTPVRKAIKKSSPEKKKTGPRL